MIYKRSLFFILLLATIILTSCSYVVNSHKNYDEIPSMLNVLTNKVQIAFEDGYFDKGKEAGLEYIRKKYPNVYDWFDKRQYEIEVGTVDEYAVVMVCDKGRPIFEDTYCSGGPPDIDHRNELNLKSCKITMTVEEVKNICK